MQNDRNMQSADSLMKQGTKLFFFQFTVSGNHPGKGNGLVSIIEKFRNTINAVLLVFVCPEEGHYRKKVIITFAYRKENQLQQYT